MAEEDVAQNPAEGALEEGAAKVEQVVVAEWFWLTFWTPAAFGWLIYWVFRSERLTGIQKALIVIMCFVWFFLIAALIAIIAAYICHGGADAWLGRQAAKLTGASFDWCAQIPDPGFDF